MNIRELIVDMLLEMEREGTYSSVLIRNVLDKYDYLEAQEKGFVKRVTEGTLERRLQIDYVIDAYSKVPVKKMKPFVRCLLRMSVYQLLFMDAVPDSAVCNEAVKLAVKHSFQNLKGFVNGVLRSIARNKEQLMTAERADTGFYPDKDREPVRFLSVVYSMPEEFVSMWIQEYGFEQTKRMLEAMLEVHPVTIRLRDDMEKEEQQQLLARMKHSGVKVQSHPYIREAYLLTHLDGVQHLPGYEEGLFAVQDVSSMLSVECAGISKGNLVVDVCAAPGGKSMLAAQKLGGEGTVIARDISAEKAGLIQDNVARLGLTNIRVQIHDATLYDESLEQRADVVLADLPCSGLGILGKKRDIKYNVTGDMLKELVKLQRQILDTVWHYVKPGGVLLYSTCTIHRQENEDMVQWFVSNYPFEAEDISQYMSQIPEKKTAAEGYLQLLPGVHETDGFFIARLRRKDS